MASSAGTVPDYCTREGLPFISWWPLDMGALLRPGSPLAGIAERAGATPARVALAWLLARAENMVTPPGRRRSRTSRRTSRPATCDSPEPIAELDALVG
ncbi:hypothetical protein ACIBQX_35655 [Nonomuraea sp. NPDC049714]|uniref:hypothetical protein n=1 Tax=Nonomuraea sp. NPDC049714 TaxID=3364357 RepID=UPI0037BE1C35